MTKFKAGDKIIRTSGFYNEDIHKEWVAIILDPAKNKNETHKVLFEGKEVYWSDDYFRKITKLDKVIK